MSSKAANPPTGFLKNKHKNNVTKGHKSNATVKLYLELVLCADVIRNPFFSNLGFLQRSHEDIPRSLWLAALQPLVNQLRKTLVWIVTKLALDVLEVVPQEVELNANLLPLIANLPQLLLDTFKCQTGCNRRTQN